MKRLSMLPVLMLACTSHPDAGQARVSRALQFSADGTSVWVVNPDSDSISQIDVATRTLKREILLGGGSPTLDPTTGRYDTAIRPRAIALADSLNKAYVAAEATSAIYIVDTNLGAVLGTIPVGAAPVAVVVSPDDKTLYAVSSEAATVARIDTSTDTVVATLPVREHPRGAALRADGSLLYVTHFLTSPGLTVMRTASFIPRVKFDWAQYTPLPDQPADPGGNIDIPNGQPRGLYAVVPRPETGELWVPHLLLATGTPQPFLDFQSAVFPTFTILSPGGDAIDNRLLVKPQTLAGTPSGNFTDVVSGPRDIAFTPDGNLALVADAQSEDVLVMNANLNSEVAIVRPMPAAMLDGIVVDAAGTHAYVLGRNTHNLTVLSIDQGPGDDAGPFGPIIQVDGDPIDCLGGTDPMPTNLRYGQRLFATSNSSQFPITSNFWMACTSCHLEGGTDGVTWHFAQGPRDTPSNAGGPINTGFLFRQATRNAVIDYDITIRVEQGGLYDRDAGIPSETADLQALSDYANYAIPYPANPNLSAGGLTPQQIHGQQLFGTGDGGVGCEMCHSGPFYTDSGKGNPTLDVTGDAGPVQLWDMTGYTCDLGTSFDDVSSSDIVGDPREPCRFDTPTLRGVFASQPYMHDGSSPTLLDAVTRMSKVANDFYAPNNLSAQDLSDLAAFVSTL